MRIVGISGSPRAGGNTDFAVERVLALVAASAQTEFIRLAEHHIRRCEGCRACMRQGHCVIQDDDFHAVMERLFAADALVVGSPVYWLSPPGVMKDFLDRTHGWYLGSQRIFAGKRAVLLSIAADSGFEPHEAAILSVLRHYGAEIVATERIIAREKDDLRNSPSEQEKVARAAERLREGLGFA